jgi:hypothetical protein
VIDEQVQSIHRDGFVGVDIHERPRQRVGGPEAVPVGFETPFPVPCVRAEVVANFACEGDDVELETTMAGARCSHRCSSRGGVSVVKGTRRWNGWGEETESIIEAIAVVEGL